MRVCVISVEASCFEEAVAFYASRYNPGDPVAWIMPRRVLREAGVSLDEHVRRRVSRMTHPGMVEVLWLGTVGHNRGQYLVYGVA